MRNGISLRIIATIAAVLLATSARASHDGIFVNESAREIPVAHCVDVVVVGGSTGAVSAAVAAAESGASVFLAACACGASSGVQPDAVDPAEDVAAADAAFETIEPNAPIEVAGLSVSVGVGDNIVYQNSYGYADIEILVSDHVENETVRRTLPSIRLAKLFGKVAATIETV